MHPTYQYVLDLLEDTFINKRRINLIDYGCGNGLLLKYLSEEKILKYKGLDINLDSINHAKNQYKSKRIKFYLLQKGGSIKLGKPNSIDAIVMVGVLQYMNKTEINNFFTEARKTLKTDGVIIITCTTNHLIYQILNIYRFILPHNFININFLSNFIKKFGMKIIYKQEKGIFISPLFSNVISLFFDVLDRILFRTKGMLGPCGRISREIMNPIARLEFNLPINYGYTLFIKISNDKQM